jgi:hypothetical protein
MSPCLIHILILVRVTTRQRRWFLHMAWELWVQLVPTVPIGLLLKPTGVQIDISLSLYLLRLFSWNKLLMIFVSHRHTRFIVTKSVCVRHHTIFIVLLLRHNHVDIVIIIILVVYSIISLLFARTTTRLTLSAVTIFITKVWLFMLILIIKMLLVLLLIFSVSSILHAMCGVVSIPLHIVSLLLSLTLPHLSVVYIPLRFHRA